MQKVANILIVEDEVEMLGFASRKLKRSGYDVSGAETLKDARNLFSKNEYDLIILDAMLPDGTGFEFCQEVRHTSDVPILFLTGKTQVTDKVAGLNAGCDYYMTKPYDFEELVGVSGSLIERKNRAVTDEMTSKNSKSMKLGPLELDLKMAAATVDGEILYLTRKEFSLLVILVEYVNQPVSSETLYEKAWNLPMNNNGGALWAQLSRLRKKLEKYRVFELVNDRTHGYCLEYFE